MSWSRWGADSSVYTYPSFRGGECCGCSLIPGGFTTTDVDAFLTHLDEHRAAGQPVPEYAYESVRAEWDEFSAEWQPRIYHAPTQGTGVCPRCGVTVAADSRGNTWVSADESQWNCTDAGR